MNIKNLGVVAALLPVVAVVAFAKPGKPTPIVFPKGKKSVTVTGSLAKPSSKVFYSLTTRKGEKYEISAEGKGTTVVAVRFRGRNGRWGAGRHRGRGPQVRSFPH